MLCASSWKAWLRAGGTGPPQDQCQREQLSLDRQSIRGMAARGQATQSGGVPGPLLLQACWVGWEPDSRSASCAGVLSHAGAPDSSGRICLLPSSQTVVCVGNGEQGSKGPCHLSPTSLPSLQPFESVMQMEMHSCLCCGPKVPFKFSHQPLQGLNL